MPLLPLQRAPALRQVRRGGAAVRLRHPGDDLRKLPLSLRKQKLAATHVLELDPDFTISAWIARGGRTNSKLLIEGLRKAGLPE
jgi:hypothetical protein